MREIKFRAYDKHLKVIRDVVFIEFEDREIMYWLDDEYFSPIERNFDEVILMQYTGLKDINKVDIYEGDILKDSKGISRFVAYNHSLASYVVTAHKPDTHLFNSDWLHIYSRNMEIIGNIYDNPELLEKH